MKQIKEPNINLNEIASDIIVYEHEVYRNEMTKTHSINLEDVIRPEKRFILCNGYFFDTHELKGYCGLHDIENNRFLLLTAVYDKKNGWKEKCRLCIQRDKDHFHFCGTPVSLPFNIMFDIGGQAAVYRNKNGALKVSVHTGICERNIFANPSLYIKEAMSFAPEIIRQTSRFSNATIQRFMLARPHSINLIISNRGDFEYEIGGISCSGYSAESVKTLGKTVSDMEPISEETINLMEKYIKVKLLSGMKRSKYATDDAWPANILAFKNGFLFMRIFKPVMELKYPIENSKVHFAEYKREEIDLEWDPESLDSIDFIHVEDLTGSPIEYTAKPLYEWNNMLKNVLSKDNELIATNLAIKNARESFREKYGFMPSIAIKICAILTNNSVIEKLYNFKCKNSEKLQHWLVEMMWDGNIEYDDDLCHTFGTINNGKSLHDILGIPKGALEHATEMEKWNTIGIVKSIFSSDSAKKYLQRMNIDDFSMLFDYLVSKNNIDAFYELEAFERLVALHGHNNWKGYIKHLNSIKDYEEIEHYDKYLGYIINAGEMAEKAEWKLKGPAMERSKDSIKKILDNYNGQIKTIVDMKIKNREEGFKKFAYAGEKFIVTYPKDGKDIVAEGMALRHCAKDFVTAVADGITTLMFIRKAEKPDTPFFTLEIRGNAIRQCHGYDNRNIDKELGLEDFLKEYCKEKDIIYDCGEELCGV